MMGHYYSEMMCDKCGKVRCICPIVPEPPNRNWIVDKVRGYKIVTVHDFDNEHGKTITRIGDKEFIRFNSGFGMMARLHEKEFKSKEDAKKHRIALLEEAIEETEEKLKTLRKYLKE